MPNVLGLFDRCTIEWYGSAITGNVLIWNYNNWNDGNYYLSLGDGFFITSEVTWLVEGYDYNTANSTMDVYLQQI